MANSKEKAEASGTSRRKQRLTPSIGRMKEERKRARAKEQGRRWREATATGLGEIPAGELDLEDAMLSPEEGDKQQIMAKDKTDKEKGYAKVYTKTHEKRAERSLTRSERREQEEECKRQETAWKKVQDAVDKKAQEGVERVIERAQLEEEELAVQKRMERRCKAQEVTDERSKDTEVGEGSAQVKVSATSKKQWKEQLGLKVRKRKCDEVEEEYVELDDEDKDPDYNPTKDLEQEFEEEDTYLDDEETFEIEKHIHAINLHEAGEYVVEIRRFVSSFAKIVRKAKTDVAREYRKLIHYMQEMVLKIGCYGPIEHADKEAMFKTIVDLTCMAWRRAMHGGKTGNAKDLQRIEETRLKVQKSTEDREIPPKEDLVEIAGEMENRTLEDRKHVKDLIKRYWAHTTWVHEEAAVAAGILKILADELDEQTYMALITVGTRPLIMVEVPQMVRQVTEMRLQREREEKAESLRNQPIEEVIASQNVPVPVLWWLESNIMLPTQYLAAMVYYFVAAEADSTCTVTNKGVAAMFKLAPSNLHKLVSGKKYAGGSKGEGKKASSLKELEERSEKMVKVIRKKEVSSAAGSSKSGGRAGKAKSSEKVKVTKTSPKLVLPPFLDDETPAAGTRGARKKQKVDETEKK